MANNQFTNVNIATLKKGSAVFAYTGTTIDKALAGDNSKLPFLGLLFADTANNAIGTPQRGGDFSATFAEWDHVLETPTGTGLTANTEYWLSDTTEGKITPVKPSISANQIRVGYSISTTQISIDFRNINSSGDEVNSRVDDLTETVNAINTIEIVANENISSFKVITIDGYNADSSDVTQRAKIAGITLETINTGFSGQVKARGEITNPSWSFTAGSPIFLNGTSISHTPPSSGYQLFLGVAKSTTTIELNFSYGILRS